MFSSALSRVLAINNSKWKKNEEWWPSSLSRDPAINISKWYIKEEETDKMVVIYSQQSLCHLQIEEEDFCWAIALSKVTAININKWKMQQINWW